MGTAMTTTRQNLLNRLLFDHLLNNSRFKVQLINDQITDGSKSVEPTIIRSNFEPTIIRLEPTVALVYRVGFKKQHPYAFPRRVVPSRTRLN
jgi:hypothetical protein